MSIQIFKKSCLITYLGIIFGIMAMYFAFKKIAFSEANYVRYSLICLMLSGICDMFDGKFARKCKRTDQEKEFGIQLDSLADTFCFLTVPVTIMIALKLYEPIHLIIYSYFMISGVTRLGYFNVNADLDKAVDYYQGIPVTTTAIIYPLLGLLHTVISSTAFGLTFIIVTFIIAILFNCKIKIPKFKSLAYYIIVPILALILVILLLVIK